MDDLSYHVDVVSAAGQARSAHPHGSPPPGRPSRDRRARQVRHNLTSTLKSILLALVWVLFALGSLASTVIAVWIVTSMARAAADGSGFTSSAAWIWFIAVVITLALPFALAVWKHQGDARRISLTMAWLPMLWNAGGLVVATQIIPDIMASALRSQGAWVAADRFGDAHSATRVLSALGHHSAEVVSPEPDPVARRAGTGVPPLPLSASGEVDLAKALAVPFTEEGTAILMQVVLEGEGGTELALPYLFDTGASFTTISSDTAAQLGVDVPAEAPTLTFNTASGPRESRMVYLPALRLNGVRIEGLLVSVCDGCVNERTQGLLGHNVMREFFAQIDYKNQRMVLVPRVSEAHPNRAYDIEPVVKLAVEGAAEVWLGRVRWVVEVHNRGTEPIRDVVPVVKFADGPTLRGERIEAVGPGETGRSLVEGRASLDGSGSSKGHYTLGLAEAYW